MTDSIDSKLNRQLASLIDHVRLAGFPNQLATYLEEVCLFDTCLMTIYHAERRPVLLYTETDDVSHTLEQYLNSCYLLDPLFNAIQKDGFSGVSRLDAMAPDSFSQSEYYHTCYRDFGLADEINMVVALDDGYSFAISLGRKHGIGSITRAELNRLQEQYTVLAALIRQFWLSNADEFRPADKSRSTLTHALRTFGQGVLTRREQEITALILQGHSSQSIAEQLSISVGTVKVHRKNIHGRLNTSTQSDIFTLFLSHLSEMEMRIVA